MAHLRRAVSVVVVAATACGGAVTPDGSRTPGAGDAGDAASALDAEAPDAPTVEDGGRSEAATIACRHDVALDPPDPLCQLCTAAKCCPAWDACADADTCGFYRACLFACRENGGDEDACAAECEAKSPGGQALADDLSACWKASCARECP